MAKKAPGTTGGDAKGGKPRPATKTAMFQQLADTAGLNRKQVTAVFDALTEMIKQELGKKGSGVVTLPGLLKILRKERPATPARQGRNPQTGEPMTIAAKPKTTTVKARPLKALKEMVK
jgi:nucleoid DNA-binding protein